MRIELGAGVAVLCAMLSGGVMAAEQPQQCRPSTLPANVELLADIGGALRRIFDRSPTFREQCDRIANATNLRVRIRIDALIPSRCRAFTIVRRRGYEIHADVHLPPSGDHSELVAHEFEHLLEQIEGLNLRRLARVRGSGVHELEGEVFETDRAQAAGRIVMAEFRRLRARATD
ncbi:MAG: hypothetical protein EHM55_16555 [Acidobacteria bacterium]|nr:MAG: hypothetical protein EHM55_16555 [Acidobacteriota bacterium]